MHSLNYAPSSCQRGGGGLHSSHGFQGQPCWGSQGLSPGPHTPQISIHKLGRSSHPEERAEQSFGSRHGDQVQSVLGPACLSQHPPFQDQGPASCVCPGPPALQTCPTSGGEAVQGPVSTGSGRAGWVTVGEGAETQPGRFLCPLGLNAGTEHAGWAPVMLRC